MSDEFDPEFERAPAADTREPDHTLELTRRYNYLKELREAQKPDLYGPGMDIYEEERIIAEQQSGW